MGYAGASSPHQMNAALILTSPGRAGALEIEVCEPAAKAYCETSEEGGGCMNILAGDWCSMVQSMSLWPHFLLFVSHEPLFVRGILWVLKESRFRIHAEVPWL